MSASPSNMDTNCTKIKVVCSKCAKRISIDDSNSGISINCPDCNNRIQIPELAPQSALFKTTQPQETKPLVPRHSQLACNSEISIDQADMLTIFLGFLACAFLTLWLNPWFCQLLGMFLLMVLGIILLLKRCLRSALILIFGSFLIGTMSINSWKNGGFRLLREKRSIQTNAHCNFATPPQKDILVKK